jgi:chemotaxis protein MotB
VARKKKHEEHVNHERWLVSYADFITLLFATFTALFSISNADNQKLAALAKSINQAFSGKPSIVPTITLDPNAKGGGNLVVQIADMSETKRVKEQGEGGADRGNTGEYDPVAQKMAKTDPTAAAAAAQTEGPESGKGQDDQSKPGSGGNPAPPILINAADAQKPAATPAPSAALGTPEGKANDALARQVQQLMNDAGVNDKVAIRQEPRGTVISLSESAFFAPGGVDVLPQSLHTLDTVLNALRGKDFEIRIEGHTDDSPVPAGKPYRTNEELSAMRASRIMEFMIDQYQYPGDKISVAGFGSYRPLTSNSTEAGRKMNRRVDIVVLNKGEIAKDPH